MPEEIVTAKIVLELPGSVGGTPTEGADGGLTKEFKELNKTFKKSISGQLTGLIEGGVSKSILATEVGAIITTLLAGGFVGAKILGFFTDKAREGLGLEPGGFTASGAVGAVGGVISEATTDVLDKGKEIMNDILGTDEDIEESLLGQVDLSKDFNVELGTQKTLGTQVLNDLVGQLNPMKEINDLERERNLIIQDRTGPMRGNGGVGRSLAVGGPRRSNEPGGGGIAVTQDVDDAPPSTAPQTIMGPLNVLSELGIGE